MAVCDRREIREPRFLAVALDHERCPRDLDHPSHPPFGAGDRLVDHLESRVEVEPADPRLDQLHRDLVLQQEHVRAPLHPVDQGQGVAHQLHGDRDPGRVAPAVVLMDDDAAAGDERGEEISQDRVVDLRCLQHVEEENVDRPTRPADLRDVSLVDDMRDAEAGDPGIEALAKRVTDANGWVVAEELADRVRLHCKQVVALESRSSPCLGPVAHTGEQRRRRAAEEAARVDDCGVVRGVITREPVEELALCLREHRGNPHRIGRQGDFPPGAAKEIPEPVADHRAGL